MVNLGNNMSQNCNQNLKGGKLKNKPYVLSHRDQETDRSTSNYNNRDSEYKDSHTETHPNTNNLDQKQNHKMKLKDNRIID